MKKYKFNYSHFEFEFVGQTLNTRNGFKHVVNVWINNTYTVDAAKYSGSATCYYYNRTWECYDYQSTILKYLRAEIDERITEHKIDFMKERGYKRLTAARKVEFKKWLDTRQTNLPGYSGYWITALCATYAAFSDGFKAGKHLYNYGGVTDDSTPNCTKYAPSYFVR